jgi:hypothetical protein
MMDCEDFGHRHLRSVISHQAKRGLGTESYSAAYSRSHANGIP